MIRKWKQRLESAVIFELFSAPIHSGHCEAQKWPLPLDQFIASLIRRDIRLEKSSVSLQWGIYDLSVQGRSKNVYKSWEVNMS